MIQFNLLPDIKIQYLKAKRQKRLVMLGSTAAIVVSVSILVLLGSIVFGLQKKNIKDLEKDITAASSELKSTKDLNKILTVQNQLKVLPDLHEQKAVATRLFDYVARSTPSTVSIARLNVDFLQHTISVSGSGDTLETVNTFTDTLKFATYHTKEAEDDEKQAFSGVVLANFARDSKTASFTITLNFDPIIFSDSEEVVLTVPNIITTRSEVEQPSALFQESGTEQ